jgi:hypothetical protein
MPASRRVGIVDGMRALSLPSRRRRSRPARGIEYVAVRVLAAFWLARTLLRHRLRHVR